jgi:uncharacterized metal-binding protein
MGTSVLLALALLQIKHWYIDFINQTDEEVQYKAIYKDWRGMKHSVKHGIGTTICLTMITGWTYFIYALILGIIDSFIHYHIDWAKMNYGNRDIKTKEFWVYLGADQMAHQLTYIGIAWAMM